MGLIVLIIVVVGIYVWRRKKNGNGMNFSIKDGKIETYEYERDEEEGR